MTQQDRAISCESTRQLTHLYLTQDPGMVQPSPSWRGSVWGWALCVRCWVWTTSKLRVPKSSGAGPRAVRGMWDPGCEVCREGREN